MVCYVSVIGIEIALEVIQNLLYISVPMKDQARFRAILVPGASVCPP